jgi:hypothetical protein
MRSGSKRFLVRAWNHFMIFVVAFLAVLMALEFFFCCRVDPEKLRENIPQNPVVLQEKGMQK